jgi:hypothetical protein
MELFEEALIVGAANVVALYAVRRFTDNPVLQAFAAGVAIHLTAEYTGVNKAYCWRKKQSWKRKHSLNKNEYESSRLCRPVDTSSSSEVSLLLSPA